MASSRRVTNPFNEKVRTRIFGLSTSASSHCSSGSEHEGEYVSPSPSPCLSYLVQNFLENDSNPSYPNNNDTSKVQTNQDNESDSDSDELHRPDSMSLINDIINPTSRSDSFQHQLQAQVTKAVEIFSFFRKSNKSIFHRNLMAYLREIGYNAGVCKTKWTSVGNLKAGNYEFVDVISPNNDVRYIIDTEFSNEFRIARETKAYEQLVESLPLVFVSKIEEMKTILKVMGEEARKSMKVNGLCLAPWRKNRYMQMKWLGSYRRSTTHLPAPPLASAVFPVKCRAVGFEVVDDSNRFLLPTVTRSR